MTSPSASASDRRADRRARSEGIALRHSRRCASRQGSSCSCRPTCQAQAWSAADGKPIRRTFPTLAAARAWRQRTQVALRRRELSAPTSQLLREAAEEWLEAARAGVVRTRSGRPYKPAALRTYHTYTGEIRTGSERTLPACLRIAQTIARRRRSGKDQQIDHLKRLDA